MKNSLQFNSSPTGDLFTVEGRFSDIDHMTEVARAWNVEFFQIGPGAFDGRFFQAETRDFQLTEAQYSQPLEQHGLPPTGLRTFAIPTESPLDLRWRSHNVTNQHLMVFPRGGEMYSITKPDFRVFTFSVREETLVNAGDAAGFPEVADFLESGIELITVEPESMARLVSGCRFAVSRFSNTELSTGAIRERHHRWFDPLAALLAEILVCSTAAEPPPPQSRIRHRAIRKTRELVAERMNHPLTVERLCEHASVSARTLQYAFREEFGMTPKTWLQARVLNQVRKRLRKSDPADTRVADVANDWGIWHMGKFAADYRRMFGELPSETLNQSLT